MDETTRDLLAAISEALDGMADWRAVAVRSACFQALNNIDRGAAADDLRDFVASSRRTHAERLEGATRGGDAIEQP